MRYQLLISIDELDYDLNRFIYVLKNGIHLCDYEDSTVILEVRTEEGEKLDFQPQTKSAATQTQ